MGDLKRLARCLGPYRRDLFLGAFLILVETVFELIIPVLMADLIDVGWPSGMSPTCFPRVSRWACAPFSPS